MTNFKLWVADTFFSKEMDMAYTDGLKEGSTRAMMQAKMKIENRAKWLTPSKQSGTDFALEVLEEVKMLWQAL